MRCIAGDGGLGARRMGFAGECVVEVRSRPRLRPRTGSRCASALHGPIRRLRASALEVGFHPGDDFGIFGSHVARLGDVRREVVQVEVTVRSEADGFPVSLSDGLLKALLRILSVEKAVVRENLLYPSQVPRKSERQYPPAHRFQKIATFHLLTVVRFSSHIRLWLAASDYFAPSISRRRMFRQETCAGESPWKL